MNKVNAQLDERKWPDKYDPRRVRPWTHILTHTDGRYVPPDQGFSDRAPRDSASEVPADYAPPSFYTRALQVPFF